MEIYIKPPRGRILIDLREIYKYKNLLLSMTRRQYAIQYSNLFLGSLWVLARPLLMTVVFVYLKNISIEDSTIGAPYSLYLYSGLILWFFFAEAVSCSASSIQGDKVLMQKLYFPRIFSPVSKVLAQLPGLLYSAIPLIGMLIYYEGFPVINIFAITLAVIQVVLLSIGVGCFFSALIAVSHDWDRFLSLSIYLGLFISPVIYSYNHIPSFMAPLLQLNPIVGPLDIWRHGFIEGYHFSAENWIWPNLLILIIFLVGLVIFQRASHNFMDKV
jgi:lipopolysaccharide transport system permease protein